MIDVVCLCSAFVLLSLWSRSVELVRPHYLLDFFSSSPYHQNERLNSIKPANHQQSCSIDSVRT